MAVTDIRVPLVVRGPGMPRGESRPQLVTNNDLAPTFARWTGAVPLLKPDGRSFQPLLSGQSLETNSWRTSFLVEAIADGWGRPAYKAVRTSGQLYVEYETGERELYDLAEDPYEVRNIVGGKPELETELSAKLAALKDCSGTTCQAAEN